MSGDLATPGVRRSTRSAVEAYDNYEVARVASCFSVSDSRSSSISTTCVKVLSTVIGISRAISRKETLREVKPRILPFTSPLSVLAA